MLKHQLFIVIRSMKILIVIFKLILMLGIIPGVSWIVTFLLFSTYFFESFSSVKSIHDIWVLRSTYNWKDEDRSFFIYALQIFSTNELRMWHVIFFIIWYIWSIWRLKLQMVWTQSQAVSKLLSKVAFLEILVSDSVRMPITRPVVCLVCFWIWGSSRVRFWCSHL